MFDYDNWKCSAPTVSPLDSFDPEYLMDADVRAFDHMQEVRVVKTGRVGTIVKCELQESGRRLWEVRFVYDPNGDDGNETYWFAESELRAV